MTDFKKLDRLLLTAIASGCNQFMDMLFQPDVEAELKKLTPHNDWLGKFVDRRLQRMRKAGTIRFDRSKRTNKSRGKWVVLS